MGGIAEMVGELIDYFDDQPSPIKSPTLEVGLELVDQRNHPVAIQHSE